MIIITQAAILNDFVVLNKSGVRTMDFSDTPFFSISALIRMVKQQRIKTIPIRSIQGSSGHTYLSRAEKANEPIAASKAPLAVARL